MEALAKKSPPTEVRLRIAAKIGVDGKIRELKLMRNGEALGDAAVQDVSHWEFQPAKVSGTPVEVEVVLEIPFDTNLLRHQSSGQN